MPKYIAVADVELNDRNFEANAEVPESDAESEAGRTLQKMGFIVTEAEPVADLEVEGDVDTESDLELFEPAPEEDN